jgi:hypothetical protein
MALVGRLGTRSARSERDRGRVGRGRSGLTGRRSARRDALMPCSANSGPDQRRARPMERIGRPGSSSWHAATRGWCRSSRRCSAMTRASA